MDILLSSLHTMYVKTYKTSTFIELELEGDKTGMTMRLVGET